MPNARQPENLLIATLPVSERDRLDPFLHRVELQTAKLITEPDRPIEHPYFSYYAVTSTIQARASSCTVCKGVLTISEQANMEPVHFGSVAIRSDLNTSVGPLRRTMIFANGRED
jgi:hypothetical protein